MTLNPTEVGFVPGITGHAIRHTGSGGSAYWAYEEFECTCGFKMTGKLTQKGKVGISGQRNWRQHLAAMNIPDQVVGAGSIQKARVRWDVFVFPRSYTGAADFAQSSTRGTWYQQHWLNATSADYNYNYAWAVGISKVHKKIAGTKMINGIYTSRSAALDAANKLLRNAEARGEEITWGAEAQLEAPAITPRLSLMEFVILVDEALESKKLGEVQDTVEKLKDFLNAVPVLQAKQQQLADHHDSLLRMGLDIGVEEPEEEDEDPPSSVGDQIGSSLVGCDPSLSG